MKQSAVEWLINQLEQKGDASVNVSISRMKISIKEEDYNNLVEQAKEMEKQQIINAHLNGQAEFDTQEFRKEIVDCTEQYYNETFKNK